MKLYNFEKYYLYLILYKIYSFLNKLYSNIFGRILIFALVYLIGITIAVMITAYFFIGVNVFLEKVHLKQYRIEKVTFMHETLDLKQFYNR